MDPANAIAAEANGKGKANKSSKKLDPFRNMGKTQTGLGLSTVSLFQDVPLYHRDLRPKALKTMKVRLFLLFRVVGATGSFSVLLTAKTDMFVDID